MYRGFDFPPHIVWRAVQQDQRERRLGWLLLIVAAATVVGLFAFGFDHGCPLETAGACDAAGYGDDR